MSVEQQGQADGLRCVLCGKPALRLLAEPDFALCPDCERQEVRRALEESPPSEP